MISTNVLFSKIVCLQSTFKNAFKVSQLCRVQHKFLHTTANVKAKLFLDTENKHAHDILKHSIKPYQVFQPTDALTTAKPVPAQIPEFNTNCNVYQTFVDLCNFCKISQLAISDSSLTPAVLSFCQLCHKLDDEQLLSCLKLISQLPVELSVRAPNYIDLWNTLDIECCQRIDQWNTDQVLLFCDAWYHLNLMRISEFVNAATRKLGRSVRKMNLQQSVQTLFVLNVTRRSIFEMHDFELNLERFLPELSIQELSIMAMGFFKTQTPIRNPHLINDLYKRLLAEVHTIEDITLVALLKILRYSSKLTHLPAMMQLLDALSAELPRFSLLSCLHIALLGSDLQCCHDPLVEQILLRFEREVEKSRLKDLERICFIIGLFNVKTATQIENKLCEKILLSLEDRVTEIAQHARCFVTCLHYLAIKGFYNTEMISSVLDVPFLRHAYGKNLALGREVFALDSYVKINLKHKNYEGKQLPEKYRNRMGKLLTHYIPERNTKYKLSTTDRILLEIKEATESVHKQVTFKHILPHYERPDVVLCYDRQSGKSIPLSNECAADYSGVILTREQLLGSRVNENIDTVAIAVAGWNNIVREKQRYTGHFAAKLNQLELLGHKYVVISWYEWRELETFMDRSDYIRRQLAKVI